MLNDIQKTTILREIQARMKGAKEGNPCNANWGSLYEKACKHAKEIEVHSCGKFPEKLIGANFPGETDEERNYRRNSFQPITKPYWKKAMRTINRVWAEQNYSIEWSKDEAKKYFLEEFPISGDVRQFFKSIVTEAKISEPNGVLVIDFDLPVKQLETGEVVINDAEALRPYATVYESCDVLMFESGDFCLVASAEKSEVEYNGKKDKVGLVFYVYDQENIYRIKQTGKKVDWVFEMTVYYEHELGYLPAWKLKGTPEGVIADEVFYESYFAPALPHLNEAVIIHSTNKSVRNKVSYPTRAYYDQPCTNKECSQGKVWTGEGESSKQTNCGTCGGTGSVKFSPFRDYVHELPTTTNDVGKDQVPFPGFAYVSPDGTIIKDNEEVIDKYLETAFLFLNIDVNASGNSKGLNDPTATKSKIDRDEQYISMLDISNELFHLLQQFLNAAFKIRFQEESTVKVKAPTIFDLTSPDELMARISAAKTAGVSNMAIGEMIVQYYEQEYGGALARKAKIAHYSDVLFVVDTADISILQTNNNVAKWQVLLHTNFERYLNELIEAKVDIMAIELSAIDAKLVERAKKDEVEMSKAGNSADNIIKSIAEGAA